jgi:hypothetical protein
LRKREPTLVNQRILAQLSPVYHSHAGFVIALAGGGSAWKYSFELLQILFAQLNINCARVFLQKSAPFCTGDRYDVLALCEYPSQCQLGGGAILLCGHLADSFDKPQVALKILALKAW